MTQIIDTLGSWQYLKAPGIPERCHELYTNFRKIFVNGLPTEVQSRLSFFFPGEEAKRDDDGLFHRADDRKWVIHVRPHTWPERQLPYLLMTKEDILRKALGHRRFGPWFKEFLVWHHRAVEVFGEIYHLVEDFAAGIDKETPEYQLVSALRSAREKNVLRLIHYLPREVGEVVADPHRDFSLLTADCLTTLPGLCTTDQDHSLAGKQMILEKAGHIVLFPGRKLEVVTAGRIEGLCHGVVSTVKKPRGAVVAFFHGPGPMGASCPS